MSQARRAAFILVPLSCLLILAGCGGGSGGGGGKVSGQPPIFTTTPPTAAAQGVAYSYSISATDPSGGTVSFSLSTSPTGAALSGNSLSWTPAASQSRTSNSFTVTATTSENATAQQSWTVSPTGAVTVNWVNTYWTPSGSQSVPSSAASSLQVSAVVPQPDGSLTVLKGATTAPGVISVAGVPAGNYWLTFGTISGGPAAVGSAFWTGASTFDAGRNVPGVPPATLSSNTTTDFTFDLSALESVNELTEVEFNPGMQAIAPSFADPANTTSVSVGFGENSDIDWSKAETVFFTQYTSSTLGPLNISVLGPAATVANVSFTNGGTNTLSPVMGPVSAALLPVAVQGSQYITSFNNAGPLPATSYASGYTLLAEPFVVGTNATGIALSSNLVFAGTIPQPSGLGFGIAPFSNCDPTGFLTLTVLLNTQAAITTDQSLGTLSYNDPFPSGSAGWTRAETFCEEAAMPVIIPNTTTTQNFTLVTSSTVAPTSGALAPVVGPVQSPTVDGGSLYTSATLANVTPMLSWSAPASGSPYGYRIEAWVFSSASTTSAYLPAGIFYTDETSVTLPPLSAGNTYVFSITALADGAAKVQTAPFRSALPTGFASVVSAPMTISAAAAQTRIHGDARVVRQLSEPKGSSPTRLGLEPLL